jgi:hypothetical protein
MEQILIFALVVSLVFCVFKLAEMKLFQKPKEIKPLKYFVRDMVLVFSSSFIAGFLFFNANKQISEFVNTITDTKVMPDGQAQVFTDAPGF